MFIQHYPAKKKKNMSRISHNFPIPFSFVCLLESVWAYSLVSIFCLKDFDFHVNEARLSGGASVRTAFNRSLVWSLNCSHSLIL